MLDEIKIYVKAGNGGNGSASLYRAKFLQKGGPDGGSGGSGGDVIVQAKENLNSLVELSYKRKYIAEDGKKGLGKLQNGRNGKDMIIEVPVGTQIFDESGELLIYDLNEKDKKTTIACGGKGGRGNNTMKSSTNQTPKTVNPGQGGESASFFFKLKIISDIGLLGFPNAGKSSFLNSVSNAKQKVANYPFTTINPKLGYVPTTYYSGFTIVDVPGLIEKASEGHGLGHRFLKHLERVKVLLHIIDINEDDVVKQYKAIRSEIENYNELLKQKTELIVLNKIDCLDEKEVNKKKKLLKKETGAKIYLISTIEKTGLAEIIKDLSELI